MAPPDEADNIESGPMAVRVPESVKLADEEPECDDDEDAEVARADLRKNRMRCDLWDSAVNGKRGNDRWQCQRAAQHWRRLKYFDIANKLDAWANWELKVTCLSEESVSNTTHDERKEAIDILKTEFDVIPGEVKPRLCQEEAYAAIKHSNPGQYGDALDQCFPWIQLTDKKEFNDDGPRIGDLDGL